MGVVVPHRAIEAVSNSANPKQAIFDFVGDLSGVRIPGNRVLVGTYMRPEKTKGGIIRPDSNKEEDVWQGKVGLVLKWGSQAFSDDDEYHFPTEDKAQVGDWVVYNVVDARTIMVNGYPCRIIKDSGIQAMVDNPEIIF